MSLFQGTAEFYRQFRSGVPAEVAAILIEAAPDRRPRSLLDIGTGTGFVVEALSDGVDDVIGIDVDADLLAVARSSVEPRPGQHVTFMQIRAEDFHATHGLDRRPGNHLSHVPLAGSRGGARPARLDRRS